MDGPGAMIGGFVRSEKLRDKKPISDTIRAGTSLFKKEHGKKRLWLSGLAYKKT
jgi:hypothetical protein